METTDRQARLAALAARGSGSPATAGVPGDAEAVPGAAPSPFPTPPARRGGLRRTPALASRVLVAGLSAAAMLGLVAAIGAAAASPGVEAVPPTTVIHRIVVVAAPPPPEPDLVLQAVPAGRRVTVVTIPPPQPVVTRPAAPQVRPGGATQSAPVVATTSGSGHQKP